MLHLMWYEVPKIVKIMKHVELKKFEGGMHSIADAFEWSHDQAKAQTADLAQICGYVEDMILEGEFIQPVQIINYLNEHTSLAQLLILAAQFIELSVAKRIDEKEPPIKELIQLAGMAAQLQKLGEMNDKLGKINEELQRKLNGNKPDTNDKVN